MKKLFFAILIFFSFETYSQYLTPKYSSICTDNPFVNININNTLGANIMKWTSLENGTSDYQTGTFYTIYASGTYICEFLYAISADTTHLGSDTVYVFDFTPEILMPNQINTLDTYSFDVKLNQYPNIIIPQYIIRYDWYINGTTQQISFDSQFQHSFETSENHTLSIHCYITGCFFNQSEMVYPEPKIISITPQDSLLCDTNTIYSLSTNISNSEYKYIWENVSFATSDTTNSSVFNTKKPGQYKVKIQTQSFLPIAESDYANINWFWDPYITITAPMGLTPNNPIYFNVQTMPFLLDNYFSQFKWDFGDGNTINYDTNHNQNHAFVNAGTYNLTISQQTNSCIYNYTTTIDIFDHFFQIEPKYESIYDFDDTVKLHLNTSYPYTDFIQYEWFYSYKNNFSDLNINKKLIASNIDSIKTKIPGKFFIDVKTINNTLLTDTAYIDFSYNVEPYIIMKINGKEYNTTDQNYTKLGNVVFSAELQPPFSQYKNDDYLFQWQVDEDLIVTKGKGLSSFEHNFLKTGIYFVRLLITDPQNCTYKYTYRIVVVPEEETIKLTGEVNSNGNILIRPLDIDKFRIFNYEKNSFVKSFNRFIMVGNEISDTIFIRQPKNMNLEGVDNVTFYLKFAGAGSLNIKLTNPEYAQSNFDIVFPSTQLSIWGAPSYSIYNLAQSVTTPYFFNSSFDPIQSTTVPFYYSPDKQLVLPQTQNVAVINGGFYQLGGIEPLLGKKINGMWKVILKLNALNSAHGYIEEYGLIFDKKLYETEITPIQMTCTDQFGREIDMQQGLLSIKDIDVPVYTLTCKAKYQNIDTIITKKIEVNVQNYSNTKYFTPNGDGINDTWLPVAPDSKCEIFIVNKLGQIVIVLKSEELPQGWDGTYYGKPLPSDSYWYIVRTPEGYTSTGILNIVR